METNARILHRVHCPDCGKKTSVQVYDNTVVLNYPLYCPYCEKIKNINIINLKMSLSKDL